MGVLIEEILPAEVAAEEAFDDPVGVALFPEEEALLTRAVDKRRREFTTVRVCARRALERLGVGPAPILPGTRGAPQWPPGIVGSMTHCAGYRAAAVAPSDRLRSVGIDAEPNDVVPSGVFDIITRPEERDRVRKLAEADPEVHADRLLFSAKESVYKAWYPVTGQDLGFSDATLTFDAAARTFHAHILVTVPQGPSGRPALFPTLTGRWIVAKGLVATAVAIPAR
jgi:4'-phosphopantetheinyl transferase EntD